MFLVGANPEKAYLIHLLSVHTLLHNVNSFIAATLHCVYLSYVYSKRNAAYQVVNNQLRCSCKTMYTCRRKGYSVLSKQYKLGTKGALVGT